MLVEYLESSLWMLRITLRYANQLSSQRVVGLSSCVRLYAFYLADLTSVIIATKPSEPIKTNAGVNEEYISIV